MIPHCPDTLWKQTRVPFFYISGCSQSFVITPSAYMYVIVPFANNTLVWGRLLILSVQFAIHMLYRKKGKHQVIWQVSYIRFG